MKDIKCPVCGAPATLEESGWCFCQNTDCLLAWSVMCTEKIAAVAAERDTLRERVACLEAVQRADDTDVRYVGAERDALREEAAALHGRVTTSEAAVKRLRAVILGAPRGTVKKFLTDGSKRIVGMMPGGWPEGMTAAVVLLDSEGGLSGLEVLPK